MSATAYLGSVLKGRRLGLIANRQLCFCALTCLLLSLSSAFLSAVAVVGVVRLCEIVSRLSSLSEAGTSLVLFSLAGSSSLSTNFDFLIVVMLFLSRQKTCYVSLDSVPR